MTGITYRDHLWWGFREQSHLPTDAVVHLLGFVDGRIDAVVFHRNSRLDGSGRIQSIIQDLSTDEFQQMIDTDLLFPISPLLE